MMQKLAVLSSLVLTVSCALLHQVPIPLALGVQYDTPNYNFAYEVNDAHTGDIKNQQESRRGDTVLGQYSLLQPDGVRRVVEYRADELAGFRATVNNEPASTNNEVPETTQAPLTSNPDPVYLWPAPSSTTQAPPPQPTPAVAVSRSSIVQTFSSPIRTVHVIPSENPWLWA